jgi:hypothetical protein
VFELKICRTKVSEKHETIYANVFEYHRCTILVTDSDCKLTTNKLLLEGTAAASVYAVDHPDIPTISV